MIALWGGTKKEQNKCRTQSLIECLSESTLSIRHGQKLKSSGDAQINGVLISNECFTHPLVIIDLNKNHPCANAENLMDIAWEQSSPVAMDIQKQAREVSKQCVLELTKEFNEQC